MRRKTHGLRGLTPTKKQRDGERICHSWFRTASLSGEPADLFHFAAPSLSASVVPLSLEPGQHLGRVHPGPYDLECDRPAHRLRLLGHPHAAHAAFAKPLQEL